MQGPVLARAAYLVTPWGKNPVVETRHYMVLAREVGVHVVDTSPGGDSSLGRFDNEEAFKEFMRVNMRATMVSYTKDNDDAHT